MFFEKVSRMFLAGLIVLLSLSQGTFAFVQRPAFHASTTAYVSRFSANIRLEMADGPAVLDRPETIEDVDVDKDNKTEMDEKFSSGGWEIRLFNDPFNKREFVARCLSTVCGKTDTESYQIMMAAHKNGMGVVGLYMFEIAELYYSSLKENGLLVDMVKVDDE
jgi:ATP-dependent Clp protease adapter protein ClpS